MITRRLPLDDEDADTGLRIGLGHFQWLKDMADVHNFGNVRKTLADVINFYLKSLTSDVKLQNVLRGMRRDVSFLCSHPLRKGCVSTDQRYYLIEWASELCVGPCELLDAILEHAMHEGDEEDIFECVRVHENTMALFTDLRMETKITVDNLA